jgi:hypothetical protein
MEEIDSFSRGLFADACPTTLAGPDEAKSDTTNTMNAFFISPL